MQATDRSWLRPAGHGTALIVVFISLCFGGNAFAQGELDDPEFRAELGRGLFLSYCASCHGADARGAGPAAAALKKKPADLTLLAGKYGQPLPREELAAFIDGRKTLASHGTREMPIWGVRLYEDQPPSKNLEPRKVGSIALLIDYLESIQRDG